MLYALALMACPITAALPREELRLSSEMLSVTDTGAAPGWTPRGPPAFGDFDGDDRIDAAWIVGGSVVVSWATVLFDATTPQGVSFAEDVETLRADGVDRLLVACGEGLVLLDPGRAAQPETLSEEPCSRVLVLTGVDGAPAWIVALTAQRLLRFEPDGEGGYTERDPADIPASTSDLIALDLDGDGAQELGLTRAGGIELRSAEGALLGERSLAGPVRALAACRRDGQQEQALVAVFEFPLYGHDDWLWLVEWRGEPAPPVISLGPLGFDVFAAGDFDLDGTTDLACADSATPGLSILHGDAGTAPMHGSPPELIDLSPAAMQQAAGAHAVVDLDRDGDDDVLALANGGAAALFLENRVLSARDLGLQFWTCAVSGLARDEWVLFFYPGWVEEPDAVEVLVFRGDASGPEVIDPIPIVNGIVEGPAFVIGLVLGNEQDFLADDITTTIVLRPIKNGVRGPDIAGVLPGTSDPLCQSSSQPEIDEGFAQPVAFSDTAPWPDVGPTGDPLPDSDELDGKTEGIDPRPRIPIGGTPTPVPPPPPPPPPSGG